MDRGSARLRNTTIRPSMHLVVRMHYIGGLGLSDTLVAIRLQVVCEKMSVVVEVEESVATSGCT